METYVLILAAAAALSYGTYLLLNRRRRDRFALGGATLLLGAVLGVLCSKGLYVLTQLSFVLDWGLTETLTNTDPTTFSFFGGVLGVCLGAVLAGALLRVKPLESLNAMAAPGMLMAAAARFGEYFLGLYGCGKCYLEEESPGMCFFPLTVGNEWGEYYLAVFMLEGLCCLAVFFLSALRFREDRFVRTLFYLCLPQILCESLRSMSFVWHEFVRVEQLLCMVVMEGILLLYAFRARGKKGAFLPPLLGLAAAALFVACEFALDKTDLPHLLTYGVMIAGLVFLAAVEKNARQEEAVYAGTSLGKKDRTRGHRVRKGILIALLCAALLAGLVLGVLTLAEYRPEAVEEIEVTGRTTEKIPADTSLRLLTWNIGYGALGANADFFMDGGERVFTADREMTEKNLSGILEGIRAESPDLIVLQETDKHSTRSHFIDENEYFRGAFPDTESAFACNFRAAFVPYPLPPIGTVESGILTLSSFRISAAERVSLPCPYSWPVKTVNFKRCLLVTRLPVEGTDRELVLVNFHLEGYDNGNGRAEQAKVLAALLQEEAAKGNYVIAGGDFNHRFSEMDLSAYPVYEGNWQPGVLEASWLAEGLTALADPSAPTCRSIRTPYEGQREGFQFYVIDGFVVSEGVIAEEVRTVDLDFGCSDHNPVVLTFHLTGAENE